MQALKKFYSAIKRSRFTYANYYYNYMKSISISFSLDIKVSWARVEAFLCSSIYFSENELSSILITFSIRLCENDFVENLRLRA